jgi:hypothetical protein
MCSTTYYLFFTDMFRPFLLPSSRCLVTRIQSIYKKTVQKCNYNKTTWCYIWFSVALTVVIKCQIILSLKYSTTDCLLFTGHAHTDSDPGRCAVVYSSRHRLVFYDLMSATSWVKHCATSRKVAGSIPEGVIDIILPATLWPWGWLSL